MYLGFIKKYNGCPKKKYTGLSTHILDLERSKWIITSAFGRGNVNLELVKKSYIGIKNWPQYRTWKAELRLY